MTSQHLQLIIDAKNNTVKAFAGVQKSIKNTQKSVKVFSKNIKDLQPTFRRMALAGTVAFTAIAGAVGFAVKAYMDQEKAEARLEQIATKVTHATSAQIEGYKVLASQLQKVGVVGDEVVISGQSQLASFTHNSKVVTELSDDLADLAVATYGTKVNQDQAIQTANMLGKALSGQLGALTRSGVLVSDEFEKKFKATQDEFERAKILSEIIQDNYGGVNQAMAETTAGRIQKLKNSIGDLSEKIGGVFVPQVEQMVDKISIAVDKFTTWTDKNPELLKTITTITAGIAGLVAIVGGLGMFAGAITNIGGALGMIGVMLGISAGAVGVVIVAITALVGVLIWLAMNWNDVVSMVKGGWDTLIIMFQTKVTQIKNFFNQLRININTIWKGVQQVFQNGLDVIKEAFRSIFDWIYNNVIKPKLDAVNMIINAIKTAINFAKRLAGMDTGGGGGGHSSRRASGGIVSAGQSYIVGEKRPELFVPSTAGRIIPRTSGGGTVVVNISGNSFMGEEDMAERVGDRLVNILMKTQRI